MNIFALINKIIVRKKPMIISALFFLGLNTIYIFFSDKLYMSNAVVLPISSSTNPLSNLAPAGLGSFLNFNMDSSSSSSFNADIYPVIITSKKMSDKILEKNFSYKGSNEKLFSILTKNKIFKDDQQRKKIFDKFSKELREKTIKVSHNQFTDIIKISVLSYSPELSKELLDSIIFETQVFNNEIFAQKEKEKLLFLESRIYEVQEEVDKLDNSLVDFVTKNKLNFDSPLLSLEKDKIERELDIKKNLLNSLVQQKELLAIQEKDNSSILYIMDPPSFPSKKTYPKTLLFSLFSSFLGLIVGFFIPSVFDFYNKSLKASTTS